MWYGPNLQRSYKYMIASKMPSLRLEQSDLKCKNKNGCDYYGNPQWQGYCSKCHREMQRQCRAEKASSSTLPRPELKRPERNLKLTSHSSFSKFEEKRLRQSETLKKANLLKLTTVFKKSSTDEHDQSAEKHQPEFKIPSSVNEGMKRDFRMRFPSLPQQVDRDSRKFVYSFIMDVMKCANTMTVDELSERVQRQYQRFMKHMDTTPHFANIDADMKELLMDFVEKHAMTYLHELPSVVFSPSGTDDERADRTMSERIQQLSWVGETHLECQLDRNSATCRQLLYKAISELLGMDSAASPGGKLSRVRRACRHVLALCNAHRPASADDLLPALIFTVLKANPPRLVSNINFVTRFCNAQRLMTGEGGYYFTNLCCAVSFIENLTAESLNMEKKEFDCYMAMPASIGGSSWAAALSLCAELRESEEQRILAQQLLEEAEDLQKKANELANNAEVFETEIAKKVQDVLAKTPLEIKPRRELPRPGKIKKTAPLIDLETPPVSSDKVNEDKDTSSDQIEPKLIEVRDIPELETSNDVKEDKVALVQTESKLLEASVIHPEKNIVDHHTSDDPENPNEEQKLTILGFEVVEQSPSKSSQNSENNWDLKQTNSMELLTPSPLGLTPFDSRSIDELMTPDEFVSDQLVPGLSNINYDIDLSDFSGDNSITEEPPKPRDPFMPSVKNEVDSFAQRDPFSPILEKFDQFSLVNAKTKEKSDPLEVVHKSPFDPIASDITKQPENKQVSILDDTESPTAACLLPSPLQPQTTKK